MMRRFLNLCEKQKQSFSVVVLQSSFITLNSMTLPLNPANRMKMQKGDGWISYVSQKVGGKSK